MAEPRASDARADPARPAPTAAGEPRQPLVWGQAGASVVESATYPGGIRRYGSANDAICPNAGAATVPP